MPLSHSGVEQKTGRSNRQLHLVFTRDAAAAATAVVRQSCSHRGADANEKGYKTFQEPRDTDKKKKMKQQVRTDAPGSGE